MKIYVNKDYNLSIANDKAPFVQGNDNYDKLYVYIEAQQVYRDNVIPTFLFEREDGAELGYYVHDTSFNEAVNGIDYVVFQKTLSSKVLSVNGLLKINIEFNFYNGNGVVYKSKNARTSNTVTEATTVGDNILIFGNPENAIESLQESLASLNIRIEPYARFSFDENGNLIIQNSMLVGENVEAVEITTTTVNTDELNVATSSSIKDLNVTGDAIISNANINELVNDTINTNNANANSLEVYNDAYVNRMSVSSALDVKGNAVITTEDKNELDVKIDNNKTDIEQKLANTQNNLQSQINTKWSTSDHNAFANLMDAKHNEMVVEHNNLATDLQKQIDNIKQILASDDTSLDTVQEIVNIIKEAGVDIEAIFVELSNKETKADATAKLNSANAYTDTKVAEAEDSFTTRMATHEATTEQQMNSYISQMESFVLNYIGEIPDLLASKIEVSD